MGFLDGLQQLGFVGLSFLLADTVDRYCRDEFKCGGKEHYACKHREVTEVSYTRHGQKVKCTNTNARIRPEERMLVLNRINDFRNGVASNAMKQFAGGGGSNMRQLSWDYRLERLARILGRNDLEFLSEAPKCCWLHGQDEPCVQTKNMTKPVVLYGMSQTGLNVPEIIDEWTGTAPTEELIKSFEIVSNEYEMGFTALAWATAYILGCTFVSNTCLSASSKSTTKYMLCIIGPEVNRLGKPVFTEGQECSACPEDTACKSESAWPQLCAAEDDATQPQPIPDSANSVQFEAITITVVLNKLLIENYY